MIRIFFSKPNFVRVLIIAVAASLVAGSAALVNSNPWLHHEWVLSTTHQPERLTELYFDNPNSLPAKLPAGKPVTLSYHIHNLEARDTAYTVRVSLVVNGQVQTIAQKKFVLPDGGDVSVPVSFGATAIHQNLQLVVDLPNQNETVFFRSAS